MIKADHTQTVWMLYLVSLEDDVPDCIENSYREEHHIRRISQELHGHLLVLWGEESTEEEWK